MIPLPSGIVAHATVDASPAKTRAVTTVTVVFVSLGMSSSLPFELLVDADGVDGGGEAGVTHHDELTEIATDPKRADLVRRQVESDTGRHRPRRTGGVHRGHVRLPEGVVGGGPGRRRDLVVRNAVRAVRSRRPLRPLNPLDALNALSSGLRPVESRLTLLAGTARARVDHAEAARVVRVAAVDHVPVRDRRPGDPPAEAGEKTHEHHD